MLLFAIVTGDVWQTLHVLPLCGLLALSTLRLDMVHGVCTLGRGRPNMADHFVKQAYAGY